MAYSTVAVQLSVEILRNWLCSSMTILDLLLKIGAMKQDYASLKGDRVLKGHTKGLLMKDYIVMLLSSRKNKIEVFFKLKSVFSLTSPTHVCLLVTVPYRSLIYCLYFKEVSQELQSLECHLHLE